MLNTFVIWLIFLFEYLRLRLSFGPLLTSKYLEDPVPVTVTEKWLQQELGACRASLRLFNKAFPDGLVLTDIHPASETLARIYEMNLFRADVDWLASTMLTAPGVTAYMAMIAPYVTAGYKAVDTAFALYEKTLETAREQNCLTYGVGHTEYETYIAVVSAHAHKTYAQCITVLLNLALGAQIPIPFGDTTITTEEKEELECHGPNSTLPD